MRPPAILPEAKRESDMKKTPKKQPVSNYSTPSNSSLTSSTSKPRYVCIYVHSDFYTLATNCIWECLLFVVSTKKQDMCIVHIRKVGVDWVGLVTTSKCFCSQGIMVMGAQCSILCSYWKLLM